MTNLATVEDFSRVFPDPPSVVSSNSRAWKSISVMRLGQDLDEIAVPAFSNHAVLVNIGQPYRLEEKLDGRIYRTFGIKGDVAVIPAGVRWRWRK